MESRLHRRAFNELSKASSVTNTSRSHEKSRIPIARIQLTMMRRKVATPNFRVTGRRALPHAGSDLGAGADG